jgi:rod shape-determining protein MreD
MRPAADWLGRLEHRLRALLPGATTMFLVILGLIPWHVPGIAVVTPAFVLIAIYFWSVYHPQLLPYWLTFLIGVVQDLLLGLPIGQGALGLLLFQGFVVSQRRFLLTKPFLVVWWGFAIIAPLGALIAWAIASIVRDAVIPVVPVVVQTAITVLLYPAFGAAFGWLQQKALRFES